MARVHSSGALSRQSKYLYYYQQEILKGQQGNKSNKHMYQITSLSTFNFLVLMFNAALGINKTSVKSEMMLIMKKNWAGPKAANQQKWKIDWRDFVSFVWEWDQIENTFWNNTTPLLDTSFYPIS